MSMVFILGIPITIFCWSIKNKNKAITKLLTNYWKISLLFFISLVLLIGKYNYALLITNISTIIMAVSVWLRVSFEVLTKRLEKRSDRPLLQTVDPQQTLKTLIKKRYPIYNYADLIVDAEDDGVDNTVSKVVECLGDYCYSKQPV